MKLDIEIHAIELPVELMQICGVSAACIYAVILSASEDGITEISRNEMSRLTGLKTTAIKDALRKLEALGIVERHYNPGYATTYHVTNILPAASPEVRTAEPEEVPAEPTETARQSEQPELKPGYKYYGEYEWIALTDEEYESLVRTYSKSKVDDTIEIIDNNIEARKMYNPSIKHGDFGKAYIKEWIEKDIRKAHPNDIIKQQEMREIGKYTDKMHQYMSVVNQFPTEIEKKMERQEEIDKYLDLIN